MVAGVLTELAALGDFPTNRGAEPSLSDRPLAFAGALGDTPGQRPPDRPMSNDSHSTLDSTADAPEESPETESQRREAEIERLTVLHAERLKDIETDRWRQGERIEALEAQNAELQADFLEQTRSLSKELGEARRALDLEHRARFDDALQAKRAEFELIERVRREAVNEAKQHEARSEQLLAELLTSKELALSRAAEHQQALERQHQDTLQQLTLLRRELLAELAAQRDQTSTLTAQVLRAKDDALAAQQQFAEQLAAEHRARGDLEKQHRAELILRDERTGHDFDELRRELGTELSVLRARVAELVVIGHDRIEEQRTALAQRANLEAALADGARELEALNGLRSQAEARAQAVERARIEAEQEAGHSLRMAQEQIEQLSAELLSSKRERDQAVALVAASTEHQGRLQQLQEQLGSLERDAARYRQAAATLENKVDKTKDTLSFRLGYLLIHAPKSWHGVRSLPRDLLELRKEAQRRRAAKGNGHGAGAPVVAPGLTDEAMRRFHAQGADAAVSFVDGVSGRHHERAAALTQLAKTLKTVDPVTALRIGQRAQELDPLPFRAKWLAFTAYDCGEVRGPASLLASLPHDFALKPSEKARKAEIAGLARVQATLPRIPARAAQQFTPVTGRVLYIAASALPFHVAGYTVRTQALVRALLESGIDVSVALRPGYPADRGVTDFAESHSVDGVTYLTLPGPHLRRTGLDDYTEAAATAIASAASRLRPELIHAASNHVNALPALLAARRLGLPFVYEVRGQWELTAATRNPGWESTERYELERDLETLVARNADQVLALTEHLARDLDSRGVARERLSVVPNAVNPEQFGPRKKDPELMLRFGLNSSNFTIIYAGSVLHYEGLDDLVVAVSKLNAQGVDTTLVVAGEGEALDGLRQLTRQLALERHVKLVGRLAPTEIPALWSVADAAAFPRKPFRVCELVSPLKPLEPMAMGIPVVVSDVAALREMVVDGQTGLVHRAGDAAALASRLLELARDPQRRQLLGRAARDHVLRERTWDAVAERVRSAYQRAVAQRDVDVVALAPGRSSMTSEEKAQFEQLLERAIALGGPDATRNLALRQTDGRSDRLRAFCLLKAAGCCQRSGHATSALELARDALRKDESVGIVRGVARVLYAGGAFEEAVAAVARLEQLLGALTGKDEEFAREARGRTKLLAQLAAPRGGQVIPTTPGRSVYFLHFSLPYTSVGYATRSHGLIAGIRDAGYDVRPYTRPGFPHDFKPELASAELPRSDVIDGIEYRRLFEGGRRDSSESEYLLSSADSYERVLVAERPELVHAASNYVTALPALIAARRLGLPFIYEIRGFWEITRSSRDSDFENSTRFASMRHFEGIVAREADHVFTLTSAMKDELVRRGVPAEKISLVHNGVDAERFVPIEPRQELARKLGLPANVPVIGYVGSFVDYEGLDDLVRAAGLLSRRDVEFRLLLVGDGAVLEELRRLVREERLDERVILTGRVPHDEVEAYYSLVDICPFPRKPWEVCEMVSPLKPFEAMAMQKVVVVSSTRALSEIVSDGTNGLVFQKGNVTALADALQRLVQDTALRRRLEQTGRAWVLQNRTWRNAGGVVVDGYRAVVEAGAARLARVPA